MKSNYTWPAIRNILISVTAISASLLTVNCATHNNETTGDTNATWSTGMRGMAQTLDRLSPFIFSGQEFSDPKNKAQIQKLLVDFSKGVDNVPRHAGEALLGKDPLVKFSLARLKSNTHSAVQAFNDGNAEFSRQVLRSNISLCFNCHTTQNFGPQDNFAASALGADFRIYPSERADYYVATRQFDKALSTLDAVVRSPEAMLDDPHEQLDSLRKYLFLQVRVKNDPAPAIALLDNYLSWKRLPYFMAADAQTWQDSLKAWQRETNKSQNYFAHAKELIRKADGYDRDIQSGLVDYLRASTLLHESLRLAKTSKDKAQIYELLGRSYETLAGMGIWDLPEVYFEACVREYPKSVEAKKCYKDYERTIMLGFTGSAGTFIPKEERQLMSELEVISGLKEK